MCSQFVDDIEIVNPGLIPVESFDGPVPPRRPNAALQQPQVKVVSHCDLAETSVALHSRVNGHHLVAVCSISNMNEGNW
jgi:hypothetical protein